VWRCAVQDGVLMVESEASVDVAPGGVQPRHGGHPPAFAVCVRLSGYGLYRGCGQYEPI
jgi:hypothetical protein